MRIMYVSNDGSLFVDEVATMNLAKSITVGDIADVEGLFIEITDMNGSEALIIFNPDKYDAVLHCFEDAFYSGTLNINAIGIDYYVVFNPDDEDYYDIKDYVEKLCNP